MIENARYQAAVEKSGTTELSTIALCYRNEKSSGRAPGNLIRKPSATERSARNEAAEWLTAGL